MRPYLGIVTIYLFISASYMTLENDSVQQNEIKNEIDIEAIRRIVAEGGKRGYYTEEEMGVLLKNPNPSNFCHHRVNAIDIGKTEQEKNANQLGQGGFGTVYKGRYTSVQSQKGKPGKTYEVAAKYIKYNRQTMILVLREINFLRRMKVSKHFVQLFQCYYELASERMDKQTMVILMMDFMANGDLKRLVSDENVRNQAFSENRMENLFLSMAKGIRDLHWTGIIHRDIKVENFLLNKKFEPYIADLGISVYINPKGNTGLGGTPYYISPEMLAGNPYGTPVDIYSLGITFYCILSKYKPGMFVAYNREKKRTKVYYHLLDRNNKLTPLIQAMTQEDPSQRPKATEVVTALENIINRQSSGYPLLPIVNPPKGVRVTLRNLSKPESNGQSRKPRPAKYLTTDYQILI